MVNKKVIGLNVFFSLLQVIVTGAVYYFLYKFLLNKVGAEQMGVWAIVLSISSTANIANLGIGSSVVRYTATFKVNGQMQDISKLIQTATLFLGAVFLVIITIVYFISPIWLHGVITAKYYQDAMKLVPFSLLCLFLNALSGVFLSCMDGLQKNYLRSMLFIISFAILMIMNYIFVPRYGLMGVAYAQLFQAAFLLLASIGSLKLVCRELSFLGFGWDKAIFRKIFSFGIQEQIISVCQLFFDPFTKSLLGNLGNLSMVTYYEMANRFVVQLRALLVSANQVMIPVFTSTHEKSAEQTRRLYKEVFSINFAFSMLWAAFIIASVIPVCRIWIGSVSKEFVVFTIILCLAFWVNIIMSVAYFANMGSAALRSNVIGNIIMGIVSVILGFGLGYLFGGYGVIFGWGIALAAGAIYIMAEYHKKQRFSIKELFSGSDLVMMLCCAVYSAGCFLLFYKLAGVNLVILFGIDLGLFACLGLVFLLYHPAGKKMGSVLPKIKRKV